MSVSCYLSYFKLHFLKIYAGFCCKGIGRKEHLHRGFYLKLLPIKFHFQCPTVDKKPHLNLKGIQMKRLSHRIERNLKIGPYVAKNFENATYSRRNLRKMGSTLPREAY